MSDRPARAPRREVELTIDGTTVRVPEGTTILEACRAQKIDTPTLCYLENLTPVNVCRVCVVEVEGSRVLVPACSRPVEPKMVVRTDSERVRLSRKLVLELLASSVDLSLVSDEVKGHMKRYEARPERFGPKAATVAQPPKTDTICPYCGVGCTLQLRVQDNSIVKVTSPLDHDVTSGHLCIKGRFGWQFVQNRASRDGN